VTAYSYEDRDKAYALISQMGTMTDLVEKIGTGKADANPDLQAAIAGMTGATDLAMQHRALANLLAKIKKNHSDRIVAAAPKDF
jgi:Rod binding domain-containing protein